MAIGLVQYPQPDIKLYRQFVTEQVDCSNYQHELYFWHLSKRQTSKSMYQSLMALRMEVDRVVNLSPLTTIRWINYHSHSILFYFGAKQDYLFQNLWNLYYSSIYHGCRKTFFPNSRFSSNNRQKWYNTYIELVVRTAIC